MLKAEDEKESVDGLPIKLSSPRPVVLWAVYETRSRERKLKRASALSLTQIYAHINCSPHTSTGTHITPLTKCLALRNALTQPILWQPMRTQILSQPGEDVTTCTLLWWLSNSLFLYNLPLRKDILFPCTIKLNKPVLWTVQKHNKVFSWVLLCPVTECFSTT